MPKKFTGLNSKAAQAKARKDEKAEAEREKVAKAKEDALWAEEEDKNMKRKRERKEREEKKKNEAAEKKQEKAKLLQEEEEAVKSGKSASPGGKVTRDDIRRRQEQDQRERDRARAAAAAASAGNSSHLDGDLEENLNRVSLSENAATNVDEAIQVLSGPGSAEKHPEKRMKAAYEAFEKERLPQLKAENSNLRLSQLKQMLRKEWMKHPTNPMNKGMQDYNAAKRN